jgi:predicted Zn-dependent protease
MQREWPAHYLDGQTPVRHSATIRLMGEGIEVSTAGGWTRLWPYREMRQTQGFYPGEEVRIERGGQFPEILVVPDPSFLRSLREAAPRTRLGVGDQARRGRWARLIAAAAAGVIALTALIYLWGIPALAALVAARVPVAWEESLGRSILHQIAPPDLVCSDPRRQRALDAILARLIAAGRPAPYTPRLLVVNRPDVNAVAVPGGTIVVFRGLLERTRTPEELAGVLAHEVEHIVHRHATQAVVQHASTGLLLVALTGDMTGPLAYGLESARALGQLQYSRQAEEEADRDGMARLLAAHISPKGMIDFFDTLAAGVRERATLRYLSTHPSTQERIAALRRLASEAPADQVPLLPDLDWSDIRAICEPPSGSPAPPSPRAP